MIIPNKVKIGFKDYNVKLKDSDVINGNEVCYGTIKFEEGEINIANIYSEDMMKCTFIHECLHGIDDIVEAKLTEDQIRLIGKGLYSFIKDNPNIFINRVKDY